MAQFLGKVKGQRGNGATRLGSKQSGLEVTAASWEGSVRVRLYHLHSAGANGQDWCEVTLAPWRGAGRDVVLYVGPVSGMDAEDGRIGPTRPMSEFCKRERATAGQVRREKLER